MWWLETPYVCFFFCLFANFWQKIYGVIHDPSKVYGLRVMLYNGHVANPLPLNYPRTWFMNDPFPYMVRSKCFFRFHRKFTLLNKTTFVGYIIDVLTQKKNGKSTFLKNVELWISFTLFGEFRIWLFSSEYIMYACLRVGIRILFSVHSHFDIMNAILVLVSLQKKPLYQILFWFWRGRHIVFILKDTILGLKFAFSNSRLFCANEY